MDYHIKAHSECNAVGPDEPTRTLQVTYRPDGTVSSGVSYDEASFRHLHPQLIKQSQAFQKVTLLDPVTQRKKVLKDNGQSVEPFFED